MASLLQNQTGEKVTLTVSSEPGKLHDPAKRKLPVGALVSSAHIDYEYFEVGTGQVSNMSIKNPLQFIYFIPHFSSQ